MLHYDLTYRIRNKTNVLFALLSFLAITLYVIGSMRGIYVLTIASLLFYALGISLASLERFSLKGYLLIISLPLSVMLVHIMLFLDARFVTGSSEANFFAILANEIIERGKYPQDTVVAIYKPEYYYYPASSMLLAILSQLLHINPGVLISYPITHYVVTPMFLAIIYKIVTSTENKVQRLLVMLSTSYLVALNIGNMLYFVYNNIARYLLLLIILILMLKESLAQNLVSYIILAIAASLYHSQEPTFSAIMLTLMLILHIFNYVTNQGKKSSPGVLYKFLIFTIVWCVITLYVAFGIVGNIFKLVEELINSLLQAEITIVEAKYEVASTVLTPIEIAIVIIGFSLFALTEIVILTAVYRRGRLNSFGKVVFSTLLVVAIFQVIQFIGIRDIYFTLRWLFNISILLTLIWTSGLSRNTTESEAILSILRYEKVKALLNATLMLFILALMIFYRIHLLSSPLYLHEANSYMKLNHIREIIESIELREITIIDSEDLPYYELSNFIISNFPGHYVIKYATLHEHEGCYLYSYLNGNCKPRPMFTKLDHYPPRNMIYICSSLQNQGAISKVFSSSFINIYLTL